MPHTVKTVASCHSPPRHGKLEYENVYRFITAVVLREIVEPLEVEPNALFVRHHLGMQVA
jgi:hypothetical protein